LEVDIDERQCFNFEKVAFLKQIRDLLLEILSRQAEVEVLDVAVFRAKRRAIETTLKAMIFLSFPVQCGVIRHLNRCPLVVSLILALEILVRSAGDPQLLTLSDCLVLHQQPNALHWNCCLCYLDALAGCLCQQLVA